MKILILTDRFPPDVSGGYELVCAAVVHGLRARGHEVLVLTRLAPDGVGVRGGPDGVRVLRLLPDAVRGLRGAIGAPGLARRSAAITREVLADFAPDLVHVWSASGISQVPLAVIGAARVPIHVTVMEGWFWNVFRSDHYTRYLAGSGERPRGTAAAWAAVLRLHNRTLGPRVALAPHPVTVSFGSAYLRDHAPGPALWPVRSSDVVQPASRFDGFRAVAVRRAGHPTQDRTIIFTGRLESPKGADIAIRALAGMVESEYADVRLALIGRGAPAEQETLRTLAADLGLGDRVELVGPQPQAEIAARYETAMAAVIPSRWQEPFGLSCLEAAQAGVPVVAARSGGLVEILGEDEGFFFDIDDVDGCRAHFERIARGGADIDERARGAAARLSTHTEAAAVAREVELAEAAARDAGVAVLAGGPA